MPKASHELLTSDTTQIPLSYEFIMPEGELFHSSFGPGLKNTIELTQEELYASIFAGGDFRRYESEHMGKPVYFLTRGEWQNMDEKEVFEILRETVRFQHDFWNDSIDEIFKVTLIPTFEEWTEYSRSNSLGGSGLTQSFISFASDNPGTTLERMRWLYNHELLHKWIGGKIRNEEEEKQYWFSEGFTDYYAYKLILKNDRMYLQEYLKTLAWIIGSHYSSEIREIPNNEITQDKFWSDYKYHKLPYRRGLVYAMLIDHQIKSIYPDRSLDQIMLGIYQQCKDGRKFNHNFFKEVLRKDLGEDSLLEFENYIEKGKLIPLTELFPDDLNIQQESFDKTGSISFKVEGDSTRIKDYLKR